MVLGHEGVGVVMATGFAVCTLKLGDRVGWGFLQDTCGYCTQCLDGTETYCLERKMYGRADLDQGSLAYGIVKKEACLFKIPDELSDEEAVSLMCAGVTVFNVLDIYGAKPTDRVGVVGIGGLGHLVVQVCQRDYALPNTGELQANSEHRGQGSRRLLVRRRRMLLRAKLEKRKALFNTRYTAIYYARAVRLKRLYVAAGPQG